MKSVTIFKQMFIAMATITMVGCLSSCKDQDFDWDNAHANTKQEKFTNVFIKEFGKPAEGHDWGAERAAMVFGFANSSTKAKTRVDNTEGRIYKQDMPFTPYDNRQFAQWGGDEANQGLFQSGLYEKPKDILPGEHHDVFAWFSKHRVYWVNTPVEYNHKTNGELDSRWCYENPTAKTISKDKIYAFYQEEVDKNGKDMQLEVDMKYESIHKYADNFAEENYSVPNYINFSNGWIQHVAYDLTEEDCDSPDHNSKYNAVGSMDFICFRPIEENTQEGWTEYHGYDFNAAKGYGWGRQYGGYNRDTQSTNEFVDSGRDWMTTNNALLYYGFDFNDVFFKCSAGSGAKHNKFMIAKLHGKCETTGKEWGGYYLGLDLESTGEAQEVLSANGWCNDWIIKIGDFGENIFEKFRIMCEDLGDPENVNSGLTISDIDYNDIVMDVEPVDNINVIKLTLQAAGGTLPLTVWYDDIALFETHELFQKDAIIGNYSTLSNWNLQSGGNDDNTRQVDVDYKKMYNTNAVTTQSDKKEPKSVYLIFNYDQNKGLGKESLDGKLKMISSGNFDISKIILKIYRFGADDYKAGGSTLSQAEWVELANSSGNAPIMLYIPKCNSKDQEVLWMNEYNNISLGYSSFSEWVQYPTRLFWETNINPRNSYLYPNSNPSDRLK